MMFASIVTSIVTSLVAGPVLSQDMADFYIGLKRFNQETLRFQC